MNKAKVNTGRIFATVILVSMILIALGGCSTANFGRLNSNQEVTRSFETYEILPNHKYYYRGTFSRPIAIAGINENYELISRMWVEVDPKSKDFRTLIDRVSIQGSGTTTRPWGFVILNPAGRDVGVWYSAIRAAAVEINENNQIVNLSPIRSVAIGNQRQ